MELGNLACPKSLKLISLIFMVNPEGEIELFYNLLDPIIEEFVNGHIDMGTLKFIRDQIGFLHEKNLRLADPTLQNYSKKSHFLLEAAHTSYEANWRNFAYIDAFARGKVEPPIRKNVEFCDDKGFW